ncbi:MAG: hypothetical protein KDA37_16010 [Planctomycetales bacterium]|nr:hypothetical protein [Planctomycetales bacterium]
MKIHDSPTLGEVPLWRRVPAGVYVAALLLLILHGPRGAVLALLLQAWRLAATFFGGDEVVSAVLSQTAPLALAMALVVILYRTEWITFESIWSVIACSAILLGGASAGAELRALLERVLPADDRQTLVGVTPEEAPSGISLAWLNARTNHRTNQIAARDALAAMSDWDYVSGLGASDQWPDRVPRVALLPEHGSWLVVVGRGANQLLGYLVFYRPRMFAAALIAGGYLGWAAHRRWLWAEAKVDEYRTLARVRRAA